MIKAENLEKDNLATLIIITTNYYIPSSLIYNYYLVLTYLNY